MMNLVRSRTGQSDVSRKSMDSQRPADHQRHHSHSKPDVPSPQDYWAGHYNRLNESQQASLVKFKEVLQEHDLYTPEPPSHDDPTLIRYLRARKFDINGALSQFRDTEKMRKENRIDDLYDQIDVGFYERARVLYPQWTGHRDKQGLPLYVYQIKHLDSKTVHTYTKDTQSWKNGSSWAKAPASAKLLPLYALYENMMSFVLPLCSTLERPTMDVPVTQGTNIVDVSGVGIKTFWNLKNHMQEASQMATAHFPETLDRIYIIGAPYFFPTVWGWIKRWFDPVTVSKIFVLSHHETLPTLQKFFDMDSIPKHYGGNLDWEYGQHPAPDAAVKERLPSVWVNGPCRYEGQLVPVGSVDGKERPRPPPLPKDRIPPATTAPPAYQNGSTDTEKSPETGEETHPVPVGAAADDHKVEPTIDGVTTGVAATTLNGEPKDNTESIQLANGVQKLPDNSVDALAAAIHQEEPKVEAQVQANGVAKPPLERFETAAEQLVTSG